MKGVKIIIRYAESVFKMSQYAGDTAQRASDVGTITTINVENHIYQYSNECDFQCDDRLDIILFSIESRQKIFKRKIVNKMTSIPTFRKKF